jgi:hypothetical protein
VVTSFTSFFDQALYIIESINPLFQGLARMLDVLSRIANQILKLCTAVFISDWPTYVASINNSWYLVDIALIKDFNCNNHIVKIQLSEPCL